MCTHLVHLEDIVVRHPRLRKEHVELPWHAAGDRVDTEAHVDALGVEVLRDVRDRILAVCDGKAVAGHDDDFVGIPEELDCLLDVCERGL